MMLPHFNAKDHLLPAKVMTILFLMLLSGFCQVNLPAQVAPVEGLHKHTPGVFALTHARIYLPSGEILEDGAIILRDGLIEDVGRRVKIPADATEISLAGKLVYPGFIEAWWEVPAGHREKNTKPAQDVHHHWNSRISPANAVLDGFSPDKKDLAALRELGFTVAHIVPERGIFRGQTAVVQLADWGVAAPVEMSVAQALSFEYGRERKSGYPKSLLGSVALIRQTFLDARWYAKAWGVYRRYPRRNARPEVNDDLAALAESLARNQPFLFTTGDELDILRAGEISAEFGVPLWIAGNGYEYRRLNALQALDAFFIVPLNFPEAPGVATLEEELQVSLAQLRHWDQAPDNPQRLRQAGITFALTSGKLKDRSRFKTYLGRAVERGLDPGAALEALTTIPAHRLGLGNTHGQIARGFVADLVVTDGDYFARGSRVLTVWIAGQRFEVLPAPVEDFRGKWSVQLRLPDGTAPTWQLDVMGDIRKPYGELTCEEKTYPLDQLILKGAEVSWTVSADSMGYGGIWRLSGTILADQASGAGVQANGRRFTWTATRTRPPGNTPGKKTEAKPERPSDYYPLNPEGAFGRLSAPVQHPAIMVRNATIWTSGPAGIIASGDLLIEQGKIVAVGPHLQIPKQAAGELLEIDAAGKHVTPGIIDAHSHTALLAVNEGTQAVTAEVRIRDVIDSDDIAIYRELAGGVTMANLLHGSANPIGGQNAVIKLRWGSLPAQLIEERAPQGIKFALGENVKRSNWAEVSTRYPQTRMGVDQIIRDAFRAARDYRQEWQVYSGSKARQKTQIPPRRDLELDALVEVLEGQRMVHAHAYRQDEILNLIRIADDFGFTIGTFQHVLEGYKVATEIARHGAGASCFADWWAYKFEVYDAIPYNSALMSQAGVLTSVNSDDSELATRLNTEAAKAVKAVKYGGLPEEEALKLVTIYPARQLKVDPFAGSLETGKDADFVIWSGHPLSAYSRCEQTWIEGRKYFDIDEDVVMRRQQTVERAKLIQKVLAGEQEGGEPEPAEDSARAFRYRSGCLADIDEEALP